MLTSVDEKFIFNCLFIGLILFHLYCCSKHKLSTTLIANVANISDSFSC